MFCEKLTLKHGVGLSLKIKNYESTMAVALAQNNLLKSNTFMGLLAAQSGPISSRTLIIHSNYTLRTCLQDDCEYQRGQYYKTFYGRNLQIFVVS